MSQNNQSTTKSKRTLKIENILPVKAVGIECLNESNPEKMSPHRYIYKWFARRPTAATRLAVLASVLPEEVTNDELLELMCIGPSTPEKLDESISEYVERKFATKDQRGNMGVQDHFGYPIPHERIPKKEKLEDFHQTVREHWGGELPTVLDPTAGGGTIPMESLRYRLPTHSNELNPVPWLINKVILEYAPTVGSLNDELRKWGEKIDIEASSRLSKYYPSASPGQTPNHYLCTYSIECPSCGNRLPLSNRWWFLKESAKSGHAIRPYPGEDGIEYEHVHLPEDITTDEFDPSEGTVYNAEAECPSCDVVLERSEITSRMQKGEFEFEVCGVHYDKERGGSGYRAASEEDREALKDAQETINSNLELSTLLTTNRFVGSQDRAAPYGMLQWRDIYGPRQFLAHATYMQVFNEFKQEIKEEYEPQKAEAILVLLSFISTKLINRNSRLLPLDVRRGAPNSMLGNNNFAFQWHFGESNITSGSYSYKTTLDNIVKEYEELVSYFGDEDLQMPEVSVNQGDARDLPYEDSSTQAVVIDPPYGENVMYAELADALYVWLREYLKSEFPSEMSAPETNKRDEAVENSEMFSDEDVKSAGASSKADLARTDYENKMSDIFSETYRVLESGGVLTVYFTDKETKAWDSLTMSLINAGFSITATHTITSEMPQRVAMRERASADSTLLLTCRKPLKGEEHEQRSPTLWNDIREKTKQAAREQANKLLDANLRLTKTDTIIGAFGPTLRVFTEEYPVVDKHDNLVRPKQALEEARTAVVEVLIDRELDEGLEPVDNMTTWYLLSWLVYERENIPYDDARQLGLGVGVDIDDIKTNTKIWGKSGDKLTLKGQSYRVRDYTALEAGEKRRKRAYPIDPREESFDYAIDAVHAALNVLNTKGSDFTWNWLNDRGLQDQVQFRRTIKSLLQVLPEGHEDYDSIVNLVSGDTGELLDIDPHEFMNTGKDKDSKTTLSDFQS